MRGTWQLVTVAALLAAACADSPTTPTSSGAAAASALPPSAASIRYQVVDLTPDLVAAGFDGQFANAFEITSGGAVRGAATRGGFQHGFSWAQGVATDLGTLGGPQLNSQASGRGGDAIPLLSETATSDPLAENFCGFGSPLVCKPALWRNGVVTALPTLGGSNGAALTGNSRGQVVGVAEDGVPDASCIPPQKSHFQAVAWQGGERHELPPLPGDQVGLALRDNDAGQVVGTTGLCSNTLFGGFGVGVHAVLWDHGTPIYLGDLGDHTVGVAADINNRGQVVGAASAPDGTVHAFSWTATGHMRDLGLMGDGPGDASNLPTEINNHGQFVGASCDVTMASCRAYLWQNGVFQDLNGLTTGGTNLYLVFPCAMNDAGQIVGLAIDTTTGTPHAFLATPVHGAQAAATTTIAASVPRVARVPLLPARARALLAARLRPRAR